MVIGSEEYGLRTSLDAFWGWGWINACSWGSRVFEPGPGALPRLARAARALRPAEMEPRGGQERGDQAASRPGFRGVRAGRA